MLTYNEITRDASKLPEASCNALLQRGFAHFLGNEQSSKLIGKIRTAISTSLSTPDKEVNQADVTKDQVQDYRAANAEQISQWAQEIAAQALAALDAGTIGTSAPRGTSADPIEAAMRRIAKALVETKLKSAGLKVPTGDKTVELGGHAYTMADLVSRQLAANGEHIKREAERALAEAARKAAKAQAETKKALGDGPVTAEGLGL